MALRSRNAQDLHGPALDAWEESKRVSLPGGGIMYVPATFASTTDLRAKEPLPKYRWRGEPGDGTIEVELIGYHQAMRLNPARYSETMKERIEEREGTILGDLETMIVSGYETLYGHYRLTHAAYPTVVQFGAYARILTRNAGLLFAFEHPEPERLDPFAKAVLATLVL
ncbi:MAG: hypothetical protein LC793_08025 [Thermomicrobia bacterium]|nr:hypothetical protein [Thermomicrobia bacterium]